MYMSSFHRPSSSLQPAPVMTAVTVPLLFVAVLAQAASLTPATAHLAIIAMSAVLLACCWHLRSRWTAGAWAAGIAAHVCAIAAVALAA